MAQIQNDQQVYALLGTLFEGVVADDEIGPRLQRIDAVVQQQFKRPEATITMQLTAGEDRAVVTGKTHQRPDVVLVMDAVTGHRVWLGELSAMTALSKGQIRARGPVAKILLLIDAIALVAPRYQAQLEGLAGGGDTASAGAQAAAVVEEAAAAEAAAEDAAAEAPAAEEPAAEEPAAEAPAAEAPAAEEPAAEEPAAEAPAAEEPAAEEPAAEEPAAEAPAAEESAADAPAADAPGDDVSSAADAGA